MASTSHRSKKIAFIFIQEWRIVSRKFILFFFYFFFLFFFSMEIALKQPFEKPIQSIERILLTIQHCIVHKIQCWIWMGKRRVAYSSRLFGCLTRILFILYSIILNNKTMTKRDLYYMDTVYFISQGCAPRSHSIPIWSHNYLFNTLLYYTIKLL